MISLKFRTTYHGWAMPYFELESHLEMPHFRHHLSPPSTGLFFPKFGLFLFAIIYQKVSFSGTDGLPAISLKFWEIVDNLPRFD